MVIAQVVTTYPPYRGGIGAVAAEYTRRLEARGFTVCVFHPENTPSWFRIRHVAWTPSLLWRLRGADVIHLHYPFYGADLFAALAAWVWRIPLVVTHHMRPKVTGWRAYMEVLNRWCVEPCILAVAKTVFVATDDYAKANRVRHRNLRVLPFGVDTDRFTVGRDDDFRRAHGISAGSTVMLFVGGMDDAHDFKGVDVLLRACATLSGDWTLLLVGSGNRKAQYEQLAVDLGIGERTKFIGAVPYDDLPRAYRAADLHVLPSINRGEAFGLVTLEAAATGIPSVVSDLPGMRSLVIPGETGLHVPPNDPDRLAAALTELLQQDGRRELMGVAARARAEKRYSMETLIDSLVVTYENRDHH